MKHIIISLLACMMRFWSRIYTYRQDKWFKGKMNLLYTLWIRCFMGEVGEKTIINKPLLLQGEGQKQIRIGSHSNIGHHCVLGCWARYGMDKHYEPEIVIGNHCSIGEYCHITAIKRITIGDGLLTGRFVYIGDNLHGGLSYEEAVIPPSRRNLRSKGEIQIGNNVWIGDKVSILGGVKIGDNVIIGAGSVVTHDIPSNSIAVGSPAKIIKELK